MTQRRTLIQKKVHTKTRPPYRRNAMTFEEWVSQFWPPHAWFMDDHDIQRWRAAYEALDRAAR
jgi:hypothetical protein